MQATPLETEAPTTKRDREGYSIMLSVADIAALKLHYKTFQWKKTFVQTMRAHHREALQKLREASLGDRLALLSPEEGMTREYFNVREGEMKDLSLTVEELAGVGVPPGLQNRSAFFRAFARLLLRGDIVEE